MFDPSPSWDLRTTLLSLGFFAAIYVATAKGSTLTPFQASGCMSVTHSIIISIWCGWILLKDEWNFVDPSTQFQANMLAFSLSYFVVDAVLCLTVLRDFEGSCHHITVVWGQFAALHSGYGGYQLAWFLFVAELSTPWLYLFQTGLAPEGSFLALASQAIFAVLFLVGRMVIAPYMATWLCDSPTTPVEVKISCLVILGISAVWATRILKAVMTFLRGDAKEEISGLSEVREKRNSNESFSAAPKVYVRS